MKVAKWNAYHHDGELDCADIVIHILDMMVDKYFDFVYDIEERFITLKISMWMML